MCFEGKGVDKIGSTGKEIWGIGTDKGIAFSFSTSWPNFSDVLLVGGKELGDSGIEGVDEP